MTFQAICSQRVFRVAEACAVEIILRPGRALAPGDRIEFQFPQSWSLVRGPTFTREFQSSDPARPHFIAVSAPGNDVARFDIVITPRHQTCPNGEVRHGRLVTAVLAGGGIAAGAPVRLFYGNTFAPYVAERETVWIRVNGESPEEALVLEVRPGSHDSFRMLAPSFARPGQPCEVLIVSLDRFDNASDTAFENGRLSLEDGTVVAEQLRFTGTARVPVRVASPGVHRFRFRDAVSNAMRVGDEPGPYWGDIHIHTKLSMDGQGSDPYGYARDVAGLDFAAAADHWESLGPEGYRILARWIAEADRPGCFVAIPADERNPPELTGHHNVYFQDPEDLQRCAAVGGGKNPVPENRFERVRAAGTSRALVIPHHTGIAFGDLKPSGIGCAVDMDVGGLDPAFRPVMEIYSHHGQSELYAPHHLLSYEWNRMRNPERRANTSVPGPFYAQDYWVRGWRMGVIASSDEHSGQGGRRHGGIAAVFADRLNREGIFEALRRRRCYATTGERILLDFRVDDLRMGDVGERAKGDRLRGGLNVWGTETLLRVDILRHRFGTDAGFRPVASVFPRPESTDAAVSFEDVVAGPCMYYARVTQQPLSWPGMAWTSPIWVDMRGDPGRR
ncbi:MAG: DUF3604 domain-containing protein [Planctomycetota bacterium]